MDSGEVEQDRMDACVHALTELADPAAVATTGGAYTDHRMAGRW
ncbi:hypothetical protein [Streptomyces sp. NPDC004435]